MVARSETRMHMVVGREENVGCRRSGELQNNKHKIAYFFGVFLCVCVCVRVQSSGANTRERHSLRACGLVHTTREDVKHFPSDSRSVARGRQS